VSLALASSDAATRPARLDGRPGASIRATPPVGRAGLRNESHAGAMHAVVAWRPFRGSVLKT